MVLQCIYPKKYITGFSLVKITLTPPLSPGSKYLYDFLYSPYSSIVYYISRIPSSPLPVFSLWFGYEISIREKKYTMCFWKKWKLNYCKNIIGYGKGGYQSIEHAKFRKTSDKFNFSAADLKSNKMNMAYFAVKCFFLYVHAS